MTNGKHNYREIEQIYGVECKQKLRHYERTSRKVGRYTSHLHFNLQCKHNNVTPKHVKIQGKWRDEEERRIIRRAEKALLNKKIGEVVKRRNDLKRKQEEVKDQLKSILDENMFEEIVKVNLERQKTEEEKSRKKQRDKYH